MEEGDYAEDPPRGESEPDLWRNISPPWTGASSGGGRFYTESSNISARRDVPTAFGAIGEDSVVVVEVNLASLVEVDTQLLAGLLHLERIAPVEEADGRGQ